MTNARLRRLTFSSATALALSGAVTVASAEDKQLRETTDFTGTFMYLGSNVPGLIFGTVRNGETALATFGETRDGTGKEPDENSIFRIGSISKVFCGMALGSLLTDGTVELTDPLQDHVDDGVTVPQKDGRTLRLIDLIAQTSGLPREMTRPDSPADDPFATNTKAAAYAGLAGDPYLFAPGTSALYSNYGFDLLGIALANAAGKPYSDLLKERVFDPLGMKDTAFNPPAAAGDRLMQGHFFDGSPLPNVPSPTGIECAGGVHTTAKDMLAFIKWQLDRSPAAESELRMVSQGAYVFRDGLETVVGLDDGGPMGAMALGWVVTFPEENRPLILEKSGGLQGFFAYVAIAPTRGVGAFFVMNQFSVGGFAASVAATNEFVSSMAPR